MELSKRKKILLLVDWFKPGYKAGGPIQSSFNFAYAFKDIFDIFVLTTNTDHGETQPYAGIESNKWIDNKWEGIHIYYADKASLTTKQLYKVINSVDADYVYLNHMFSPRFVLYPLWLKWRGKLKSNVVLCPRGALYQSALSVKRYKKSPVLSLVKLLNMHRKMVFHATNEREYNAIQSFFPGSNAVIADNLPRTDQPPAVPIKKEKGYVKCVFIGRIVPIKNLSFLLQALRDCTVLVKLTVIGPVEDEEYWKKCQKMITELDNNIEVTYAGPKDNDEVFDALSKHHLYVLPTTGENFGHSIFEALFSGRPVLISDQTPWHNLPVLKAGWDLPLNDSKGFARIIDIVGNFSQEEYNVWLNGAWSFAHDFINNPKLKQPYFQLFV
jgi:glycosyltransferase involved in cell wall biosynthesis